MRQSITGLTFCLLLGSCASSSQPPGVGNAPRRAVNQAQELAWLACKHDLHNLQIQAGEFHALAGATSRSLQQCLRISMAPAAPASAPTVGNQIFQIHFDFGSTEPKLQPAAWKALAAMAQAAPLILLRGRTDGELATAAEGRIAMQRAEAVRQLLVAEGLESRRIRATYQPIGDHLVDNGDASARHLNRRVEVEIYQTLPMAPAALAD